MKRSNIFFVFAVTFFGSIIPLDQKPATTIDHDFCGNKHKNLVILQSIVQDLDQVSVPEFIGIPSGRVEKFLRENAPAIFPLFEKALYCLEQNDNASVLPLIEAIQQKIKECFTNHEFIFSEKELQLFARIAREKQFFMVRSTGVEDGAIANAGGNASIAYVEPEQNEIQSAMAEVIASYFGMQSLKNRIGGGEQISSTNLCLPVLIQVLIGEPFDGADTFNKIPVSGVAYTTNQSLSSENFLVTEIDAAYGHGEGVVANRVIADRYFVTPSKTNSAAISIYPMLYHKQDRLVPHRNNNNAHTLIHCTNSDELAHKSALSRENVTHLYHVLKKIETAYGQPMDVEFVILDNVIYIVQARPAMYVPMNPSYVQFAKIASEDISIPVSGTCIVPGKAAVVVITNPKDLILTKTLDEADQMPNSTTCKAVVVSNWASSLSHAAVNFKTYGTPCLMLHDLKTIQKLLPSVSERTPLIIDIQQRSIVHWNNSEKSFHDSIAQGWLEHPIDRTLSLWLDKLPVLAKPANPLPQDGKLLNLVEQFKKTVHQDEQKKLLGTIVERVNQKLALTSRRINHFGTFCKNDFKQCFATFTTTFNDLITQLNSCIESQAEQFEFLFYHKMLEALLFQSADAQKVLGGYSHISFLDALFDMQQLFIATMRLNTDTLEFENFFN